MIAYILEVSIAWALFYLLFHLVLRQTTFFVLNRWYLVSSFLLGLLLPLLPPLWVIANPDPVISEVVNMELLLANLAYLQHMPIAERIPEQKSINWWLILYYLGVVWMMGRFLYGMAQIGTYFWRGEKIEKGVHRLIMTRKKHLPFSFFKWIFWGQTPSIDDPEAEKMLRHEEAHIRQGHTFDVLLVELVGALAWFSPLVYLYRKALRTNHEFLADAAVTKDNRIKEYGHLLIRQSLSGPQIALVNHLIHSQLKNRIIMMTKKRSTRLSLLRYLLTFPLAALLLMAFSYDKAYGLDEFPVLTEGFPSITLPDFSKHDETEKSATANFLEIDKEEALANEKVLSLPFLTTKNIDELNSLSSITTTAADTTKPEPLIVLNGKVVKKASMDAFPTDKIKSVNVIKGEAAIKKYGEKGQHGVVEINCPDCELNKLEKVDGPPAMDFSDKLLLLNGVEISEEVFQSIDPKDIATINIWKGDKAIEKYGEKGQNDVVEINCPDCELNKLEKVDEPPAMDFSDKLLLLNGVEISEEVFEKIDPKDIATINIWKGDKATEKYGEKGQNGVIEISCPTCETPAGGKITLKSVGDPPLYVINGQVVEGKDPIKDLNPEDISSVSVLKGKAAFEKYGDKGKNGVVEIDCPKCKPAKEAKSNSLVIQGEENQPLFIINGKKIIQGQLEDISPKDIKSIKVLKDAKATAEYGEEGKNGVILIDCPKCKLDNNNDGKSTFRLRKSTDASTDQKSTGSFIKIRNQPYSVVDEMPVFQGCEGLGLSAEEKADCSNKRLAEYVYSRIKYPSGAKTAGGQVVVEFVVTKAGKIRDAQILKSMGDNFDNQVLEMVRQLPLYQAGKQNGKKVDVKLTLPVMFKPNVPTEIPSKVAEMLKKNMLEKQAAMHNNVLDVKEFSATPNPIKDQLHLRFRAEPQGTLISIIDASGREIMRKELQHFNGIFDEYIDLAKAPKGLLLINISQNDQFFVHKIMAQ